MKTLIIGDNYVSSYFEDIENYTVVSRDRILDIDFDCEILQYDVIVNCHEIKNGTFSKLYKNNSEFPVLLNRKCEKFNKKFVQISTADLYMHNFDWNKTVEDSDDLNIKNDYLLTKRVAEKRLSEDSLILRIKNPFDGRYRADNWLLKSLNRKTVYNWIDTHTYLPDLQTVLETLVYKNISGIFNTVQKEANSELYYFKEVLKLHKFSHLDVHVNDHPDIEFTLGTDILHADVNSTKLQQHLTLTPEPYAIIVSWEQILKLIPSIIADCHLDSTKIPFTSIPQ